MKMSKEDIQFKIGEIRKDKIIFAVEIVATCVLGLFVTLYLNLFPLGPSTIYIAIGIFFVVVLFSLFLTVRSLMKLRELRKLEKMLK